MFALSGEAWAGLLGGLGGAVVGGLISWLLQWQARKADRALRDAGRLERRTAIAHAIVYKLIAISSHYAVYRRGLEQAWERGASETPGSEPWQFVLASAHEPDPIHFTTDEMTLLVELGMEEVFNSLLTLAEAHNQMGVLAGLYARRREELSRGLPPTAFVDGRLVTEADRVTALRFRPLMIELNGLATTMRDFAARDAPDSLQTLERAHAQFASKLGIRWKLAKATDPVPSGGPFA